MRRLKLSRTGASEEPFKPGATVSATHKELGPAAKLDKTVKPSKSLTGALDTLPLESNFRVLSVTNRTETTTLTRPQTDTGCAPRLVNTYYTQP